MWCLCLQRVWWQSTKTINWAHIHQWRWCWFKYNYWREHDIIGWSIPTGSCQTLYRCDRLMCADAFSWIDGTFQDSIIALDTERFIGQIIEWLPCNPNLNPCDYFSVSLHEVPSLLNRLENLRKAITNKIQATKCCRML